MTLYYMTARIKNKNIDLFYCACANELVVNNGNRGEIIEKLRGELWEGRAVDGKLVWSGLGSVVVGFL